MLNFIHRMHHHIRTLSNTRLIHLSLNYAQHSNTPSLQHSNTPLLRQYFIGPSLIFENIYDFYIDDSGSVKKFSALLTNREK